MRIALLRGIPFINPCTSGGPQRVQTTAFTAAAVGWYERTLPSVRKGVPRRRSPVRGLASSCGLVQGHGGANESFQRLLVDLLALVEVDGTSCVPLKTGVEEARRILQRRTFGESHLHDVLVGLACADQSVARPHRSS